MRKMATILVPTDFSPPSEAALTFGLQLARRFDAHVWLLHAYALPAFAFTEGVAIPKDVVDALAKDAREGLERVRAQHQQAGVEISVATLAGAPAPAILEWAKAHAVDLIVMGTHGRTGMRHLLAGSVAERVVRLASCPVVTVRE